MAISRDQFAKECAEQALLLGVNPHFLVAAAQLLSGINDDKDDDKIGPFRVLQAEWNANGSDPAFDIALQPDDIEIWQMQCSYAALQVLRAQRALIESLKRNPTPDELYAKWPNAPVPAGKTLQGAIDETKDLIIPAVDTLLAGLGGGAALGNIKLGSLSPDRKAIAELIVNAFATAGYGKIQQIAALANAIAESNLNPDAHNAKGEDSVGLFQLNRNGGVGTGHTVESLKDPAKNTALIIAECNKVAAFKAATSLQEAVAIFVRKVERPANADGEVIRRFAIAQKL